VRRTLSLLALLGAASGCANAEPVTVDLRARLDRIADSCRLPRSAFKIDAEGRLHVQPPASVPYRDVDCAFTQLRKQGVETPIAIVGKMRSSPPVKP
jgi:hypothetical protein